VPTKKAGKFMPCDAIEATTATQVRVKLHKDVIEMYQQDIEDGAKMPPVVVFAEKGSARHILADGFHRLLATVNAGKEDIEVDVHKGGMHEALEYALSANRAHGLRRSNADKINAVQLALKDPAISQHTQQEIADLCGVSVKTVQRAESKGPGKPRKPQKPTNPEPNKPENNRPTKPEPTQEEFERAEVRQAVALIKVLPYPGDQAIKLDFDPDDMANIEYAATWLSYLVMEYRNARNN
jgi:ParB-like chromosome segregation protein Spo0J